MFTGQSGRLKVPLLEWTVARTRRGYEGVIFVYWGFKALKGTVVIMNRGERGEETRGEGPVIPGI